LNKKIDKQANTIMKQGVRMEIDSTKQQNPGKGKITGFYAIKHIKEVEVLRKKYKINSHMEEEMRKLLKRIK
jgi:hypothetical protein